MRALKIGLIVLSGIYACAASATTVVGIWTEKQVTIAADCKQTVSDGQGTIMGSQNVCKIYEARGLVFAFAGLAKAEQIDVVAAVRNAHKLHEQGTGRDLPLLSLLVAAQGALAQILNARGISSDANATVEMIIGGVMDGKLEMVRVNDFGIAIAGQYVYSPNSQRITYPDARGYNGSDPNRGIEILGFDHAINTYKASHPNWSKEKNVSLARHFIKLEAADRVDSKYVGLPQSEVIISKHRIKWIKKGICR